MSGSEKRWPLEEAKAVAGRLRADLAPFCECIENAGSIRRGKADVGDIELLYIPRPGAIGDDPLDLYIQQQIARGLLAYRLSSTGHRAYGPKNKLLAHVPSAIPLDLFATTEENWGMALLVRTGPAEFNIRVMQRFRALGMRGHAYGGATDQEGQEVKCPDEATVFRLLGWPEIPPERRA